MLTSNQTIRWIAKPVVFLVCLLPFAWLIWALGGMFGYWTPPALSPNPLSDITNETGVWAIRFICLTLAMTPLRRLGVSFAVRFRRMVGLFASISVEDVRLTGGEPLVRREFPALVEMLAGIDGVRVTTPDGWWLLRPSNTQAVLVARAEARDEAGLSRLKQKIASNLQAAGVAPPAF